MSQFSALLALTGLSGTGSNSHIEQKGQCSKFEEAEATEIIGKNTTKSELIQKEFQKSI